MIYIYIQNRLCILCCIFIPYTTHRSGFYIYKQKLYVYIVIKTYI